MSEAVALVETSTDLIPVGSQLLTAPVLVASEVEYLPVCGACGGRAERLTTVYAGTVPNSSANSRTAPASGVSPRRKAPPGYAQVPGCWTYRERSARR